MTKWIFIVAIILVILNFDFSVFQQETLHSLAGEIGKSLALFIFFILIGFALKKCIERNSKSFIKE